MPEAPIPAAPLGGARLEPRPGLVLAERTGLGQIALRAADIAAPPVAMVIAKLTGARLGGPLSAEFAEESRGAVWMAPDEALLFVPRAEVEGALANIAKALAGTRHMALDLSDARAVLALDGPDAAETLAKGVPVDLAEAAFPVGRARRTHLGGLAVGLWRRGPTSWEIVCFRSYAHHLLGWLERSGAEGAEVGRFAV